MRITLEKPDVNPYLSLATALLGCTSLHFYCQAIGVLWRFISPVTQTAPIQRPGLSYKILVPTIVVRSARSRPYFAFPFLPSSPSNTFAAVPRGRRALTKLSSISHLCQLTRETPAWLAASRNSHPFDLRSSRTRSGGHSLGGVMRVVVEASGPWVASAGLLGLVMIPRPRYRGQCRLCTLW